MSTFISGGASNNGGGAKRGGNVDTCISSDLIGTNGVSVWNVDCLFEDYI